MSGTGGNLVAPCHYEEDLTEYNAQTCDNCGGTEHLMKCSKCHTSWYCSQKCQKTYWPFHKAFCRRNDFADATEGTEPKFARWMRNHGKQAVLKDDEVDRLDRKVCDMQSMYGRANPKPEAPEFDAEDMRNMNLAEEKRLLDARETDRNEIYWKDIKIEPMLGLETEFIKWRQNQTYVEVFIKLDQTMMPRGGEILRGDDFSVNISRTHLRVQYKDRVIVDKKKLFKDVKVDLSTWVIIDNVLEICLLKFCRRGAGYAGGRDNNDTFWRSLFSDDYLNALRLKDNSKTDKKVPEEYFQTEVDENYGVRNGNKARESSGRPMVSNRANRGR